MIVDIVQAVSADVNAISLILVLIFAAVLAYRIPFLNNRKVANFSILQVLYLVVIPGFVFVLALSEMQQILTRPMVDRPMLPDKLLVSTVLLASLYAYGGIAIHAVTKMLSTADKIRFDTSEIGQMNKFFHLQFSHTLAYGGAVVILIGFSLLELNHLPDAAAGGVGNKIFKGLLLGICYMLAVRTHVRSKDEYVGRLSDFKVLFILLWVGLVLLLYAVRRIRPGLGEYEILTPAMVGLAVGSMINAVLVFRRLKRGRYALVWKWKRLFE